MKHPLSFIYLALVLGILAGCNSHTPSTDIAIADSLLWANPDSCIQYIHLHPVANQHEEMRQTLIMQHAEFKINRTIDNDSTIQALESYFSLHKDYRSLGEVDYLIGSNYSFQGYSDLATTYLKKAEQCYELAQDVPDILWGMLYYQLGYIAQDERMYAVAREYHQKSIPFFSPEKHATYLAASYMCLAGIQEDKDIDLSVQYIDSALHYSSLAQSPVLYKETEIRKYQYILEKDTDIILQDLLYLCDSCRMYSYAAELTAHYLTNNDFSKAESYLTKLANDTANYLWCKQQYFSLLAHLQHMKGDNEQAFITMNHLNGWQTAQIESSAYERTYIISQRYEAAKQAELRQQETIKKERAYIWIAIIALVSIMIGFVLYSIYKNKMYKLRLSKEREKRLVQELEHSRDVLRTRIRERIEVTKQVQRWASQHSKQMPDIVHALNANLSCNTDNWKPIYDDFDLCFNGLLSNIVSKCPELTDSDKQYLVLSILQFDVTDICFLLDVSNRTIWNRKSVVKRHLGMAEDFDLDAWIRELQ